MKPTEIIKRVRVGLQIAIDSHEVALKRGTDTGVMWRLTAYREVLAFLNKLEAEE